MVRTNAPPPAMHVNNKTSPGTNEPVCERKNPTAKGPKNPPRLPRELISPKAAAAAENLARMPLCTLQLPPSTQTLGPYGHSSKAPFRGKPLPQTTEPPYASG